MKIFSGYIDAFEELFRVIFRHRGLILELTRREFTDKYTGQMFGVFWGVFHPLFLMGLYVFVFSYVFKQKLGGTHDMPLDYTTYILSGMIGWISFQESMIKSCTAITSNSSLVKQVVFPLEVLPIKGVISSVYTQILSLMVIVGYVFFQNGYLHVTYFLLPIVVILQILLMIGVALLCSAIGVYFKDLKDLIQVFSVAGIYMMPIFYLPTWVPEVFKPFLYINPFSYLVWCYQDVLYFGRDRKSVV